jgi:hypothetical protein
MIARPHALSSMAPLAAACKGGAAPAQVTSHLLLPIRIYRIPEDSNVKMKILVGLKN